MISPLLQNCCGRKDCAAISPGTPLPYLCIAASLGDSQKTSFLLPAAGSEAPATHGSGSSLGKR